MHPRTEVIQAFIEAIKPLTKDKLKVFASRPNQIFLAELPCILVYFEQEEVSVYTGDKHFPKSYSRTLSVNVDILVNENKSNVEQTMKQLDDYSEMIEALFHNDTTLNGKGYGGRLARVVPFSVEDGAETNAYCQRNQFLIDYSSDCFADLKLGVFKEYDVEIKTETGASIEAQGSLI